MPAVLLAYVRRVGPYGFETFSETITELMRWAGPRGFLDSGLLLSLFWDNLDVTPASRCRTDVGISVPLETQPHGPIAVQTIPGGPHAVCRCRIMADGFAQAWDDAFAWLVASGHVCDDRPCFQLHHGKGAPSSGTPWFLDICIPLRPQL